MTTDDPGGTRTRNDAIRVVNYGKANWRTVIRDACDDWSITGPPYRTKIEALSMIPEVERTNF